MVLLDFIFVGDSFTGILLSNAIRTPYFESLELAAKGLLAVLRAVVLPDISAQGQVAGPLV